MADGSGIREGNSNSYSMWGVSAIIGPRVFSWGPFQGSACMSTGLSVSDLPTDHKNVLELILTSLSPDSEISFVIMGSILFSSINSFIGLLMVGISTPFKEPLSYSGCPLTLECKPISLSPSQSCSRIHSLSFVQRIPELLSQFILSLYLGSHE